MRKTAQLRPYRRVWGDLLRIDPANRYERRLKALAVKMLVENEELGGPIDDRARRWGAPRRTYYGLLEALREAGQCAG